MPAAGIDSWAGFPGRLAAVEEVGDRPRVGVRRHGSASSAARVGICGALTKGRASHRVRLAVVPGYAGGRTGSSGRFTAEASAPCLARSRSGHDCRGQLRAPQHVASPSSTMRAIGQPVAS